MAVRKKKTQSVSDWSWRLAGVVLCAFFGLGMLAGLGVARRSSVLAVPSRLLEYGSRLLKGISPLSRAALAQPQLFPSSHHGFAVAMLERKDGFYALSSTGELRGPVSAQAEDDLPILTGAVLENARPAELLEYAETLVRAEAALGELVSEMSVAEDSTAALYLERSRTEIDLDLANSAPELEHASFLLRSWRGHRDHIAALDMTMPGQAVMRLTSALPSPGDDARTVTVADRRIEPPASRFRSRAGELVAR
jgi:hypothetical protein